MAAEEQTGLGRVADALIVEARSIAEGKSAKLPEKKHLRILLQALDRASATHTYKLFNTDHKEGDT